jgi:arylsulfatase A-like enzyme
MRRIWIGCSCCFFASLLAIAGLNGCFSAPKKGLPALDKMNVVLIVVDTLATKHLGTYNPELKNSPAIDRLAADGIRFNRAYAPAPWTKPSIGGIMTGKVPTHHGLRGINDRLAPENQTLAEELSARGFKTAGFISHMLLLAREGFDQGFDKYQIYDFTGNVHDAISSAKVSDLAINWLKSERPGVNGGDTKNFFLFLHYFDPHYNYLHHAQFDRTAWYKGPLKPGINIRKLRKMAKSFTPEDIRYLIDLYHEEIAFTDYHIGRVLDSLKEFGLRENTLVILTADHGEEFFEHGWLGHTLTLYDELINVPLIFSLPGTLSPGIVDDPVSTIDIFPTLLNRSATKVALTDVDGRDIDGLLRGEKATESRNLFAEVDFESSRIRAHKVGVGRDREKLIFNKEGGAYQFYDRATDKEERKDLYPQNPQGALQLKPTLDAYRAKQDEKGSEQAKEPALERTPEEVEQLKSLGYM